MSVVQYNMVNNCSLHLFSPTRKIGDILHISSSEELLLGAPQHLFLCVSGCYGCYQKLVLLFSYLETDSSLRSTATITRFICPRVTSLVGISSSVAKQSTKQALGRWYMTLCRAVQKQHSLNHVLKWTNFAFTSYTVNLLATADWSLVFLGTKNNFLIIASTVNSFRVQIVKSSAKSGKG